MIMNEILFNLNPRKSIQARLSLVVGGAALLLVVALSLSLAEKITSVIEELQGNMVAELAFQLAGDLDRSMHSRKHEITFFSSMIRLREEKFAIAEKRRLLDKIREDHPVYAWLGVTDSKGKIIAGSDGLLEGADVSARDYFTHGKDGFFVGDVHEAKLLATLLPKPVNDPLPLRLVDVSMPIRDSNGAFIGVLVGHMSWEWSTQMRNRLLSKVSSRDAAEIFVLRKDGQVLMGPDDYLLGVKSLPSGLLTGLMSAPQQHAVSDWVEGKYLNGYAAGQGYQDYTGLGWQVVVREPMEAAFASANSLRDGILVAGVAAILLLGAMGWFLTGYILRPLRQVAHAAERIRRGNAFVCIPHFDGEDEAAILADSMGRLVSELQENNTMLESKVLERTRELAQKAQMIEQVADAIILLDMDRNIRECNAGAVKMFGYSEEELKALAIGNLYPVEEWESVRQHVANEFMHKDMIEVTPRYVKKSGELLNAHAILKLLHDEDGEPEGILVYIVDVTARVAMEERLVLSQQIAHYGLWDWNIQTNEMVWTDEIYRIFGLDPQQPGASYPAFVERTHPDDRAVVTHAVRQALESDQRYEVEHRILKPGGEVREVLENGQVYRDRDGKPIRMVGVVHDITERKAIQKQIDLFRQMIETSNDPVYLMDADDECRLVYVNEAAVRHWQAPRETLLNWRLADWDPNFTLDKISGLIEFAKTSPGALIETEHRTGNGEMVPVSVSVNLLEIDHKVYLFGYFKDVTERRKIEHELAEAKEKAEGASEAKSSFLANMSHEIRTPMNAIIGFSHLCLQTPLDAVQRDYLEKVHQSANSLLCVINDILDFSKIESGKLALENESFELGDVLGAVAAIVGIYAEEKGIELLFDETLSVPQSLTGDSLRLGQILNNLANNAVKFTASGEVIIKVEVISQAAGQVMLRFTVSDTGIGMTADQVDKIFQPFTQADASTTRKYGGTGLGLAICRQLVALLGGRIWVESDFGAGSRFIFEVPFAVAEQNRHRVENPEKYKVLVVDDNDSARRLMSDYLYSFGIEASVAASAVEAEAALVAAGEHPYSDVLLDWAMPDCASLDFARRIKQSMPLVRRPGIVYLTGHAQDPQLGDMQRRALLDVVLSKPVTAHRLLDALMGLRVGKNTQQSLQVSSGSELAGLHVLLVEDNEVNQQLACAMLNRAGVRADCAGDGLEALQAIRLQAFDAVLMDLQMPNMDGLEATRQIRKNPAWIDLPVIAMTANAMSGDRERCLEAGMNDYISKPINIDALYAALSRWALRKAGGAATTHDSPALHPEAAIRNMGGQDIYLGVLEKFIPNQGEVVSSIRDALAQDDMKKAQRLVHTLKGIAATIGATRLSESASLLEQSLHQGRTDQYASWLIACDMEMAQVIAGVNAYLESNHETIEPAADDATIVDLEHQLMAQLQLFDSRASETMRRIRQQLKGTSGWQRFIHLNQYINAYDYETALTEMQRIAKEYL
jgi:two-component system sensor histidine kinase/response regulator